MTKEQQESTRERDPLAEDEACCSSRRRRVLQLDLVAHAAQRGGALQGLREGDAAQEGERAEVVVRQVDEPLGLLFLLGLDRLERAARLVVGDEEVAVHAQEDGEEGLARLEVAVRAQALQEGVEERVEVRDGRQGADLEVDVGRRQRLEVLEEALVCTRVGARESVLGAREGVRGTRGGDAQLPSRFSPIMRRTNSVSMLEPIAKSSLRLSDALPVSAFLSLSPAAPAPKSNRVSTPGSVGRKNGARSGALGASLGLLRALIVSRLRSVAHRERGMSERVRSESAS